MMGMEDRQRLMTMAQGMIPTPAERALIYEQVESCRMALSELEGILATSDLSVIIGKASKVHMAVDYIQGVMSGCMTRNMAQRLEDQQ